MSVHTPSLATVASSASVPLLWKIEGRATLRHGKARVGLVTALQQALKSGRWITATAPPTPTPIGRVMGSCLISPMTAVLDSLLIMP